MIVGLETGERKLWAHELLSAQHQQIRLAAQLTTLATRSPIPHPASTSGHPTTRSEYSGPTPTDPAVALSELWETPRGTEKKNGGAEQFHVVLISVDRLPVEKAAAQEPPSALVGAVCLGSATATAARAWDNRACAHGRSALRCSFPTSCLRQHGMPLASRPATRARLEILSLVLRRWSLLPRCRGHSTQRGRLWGV
jgi:hypothetical protein